MREMPKCEKCGRQFKIGEEAFEREVKVANPAELPFYKLERRYSCAPKCP